MEQVPSSALDRVVHGVNLMPGTLRDQLGEDRALLVFLRHFGCIFCRETVAEIRAAVTENEGYPKVIFFYEGTPTQGRAFIRQYWPQAHAVADEERAFYGDFALGRGGLVEMFRPAVWSAKRRAADKGHSNGAPTGDVFQMPGIFLVEGERILWQHEFQHAADHPDFVAIPSFA